MPVSRRETTTINPRLSSTLDQLVDSLDTGSIAASTRNSSLLPSTDLEDLLASITASENSPSAKPASNPVRSVFRGNSDLGDLMASLEVDHPPKHHPMPRITTGPPVEALPTPPPAQLQGHTSARYELDELMASLDVASPARPSAYVVNDDTGPCAAPMPHLAYPSHVGTKSQSHSSVPDLVRLMSSLTGASPPEVSPQAPRPSAAPPRSSIAYQSQPPLQSQPQYQPSPTPVVASASRGTVASSNQMLDDLLASIPSDTSVPSSSSKPIQPAVSNPTVDALINDIAKTLGGAPASQGDCAMCGRPVYGDAIHAIGKKWHVDHWVCVNCQTPIGAGQFYEVNGKPHCIPCHKALFAPRFFLACFFFCICWKFGLSCCRCGMCNQPILDRCVVALGRKWHVDHFVCTTCKQPFTSQFFTRDGMPYCELHARV